LAAGIPLYLFSAALHYLIAAFEDSRRAERRALESQVVAREAELRALRAQLNPHFLFNSLNSINALVGRDPEAARRMCEGLGDFLRRTLALGAQETVSLGEELELIGMYLAIEHVRFGARLGVTVEAGPAERACRVPPLLLQPLVENAVKHGIAARLEGGTLEIRARQAGDALRIEIANPLDPDAGTRDGQGLGLDNVRRRLRAFDSRRASVTTESTGGRFIAVLTLPADQNPPEAE
jgi:LytS/YehU family sensor histidine kinase